MCDKCTKPFEDLEKIIKDKRRSKKNKINAALQLAMWHRPGSEAAKYIRQAMDINDDRNTVDGSKIMRYNKK